MGKKTVVLFECDLCGKDFDEKETSKLQIKKGKKNPHTWDLCPACTSKLETQLVSDKKVIVTTPTALDDMEGVQNIPSKHFTEPAIPTGRVRRKAEPDENDKLIAEKLGKLPARAIAEPEKATGEDCCHMNKTGPYLKEGTQQFYQKCKDCGTEIRMHSKNDNGTYMSQRLE